MLRIGIAVEDLVGKDAVLILVRGPVIQTDLGAEGRGVSGMVVDPEQIGGIALLRVRMIGVHLQEHVQIIVLVVDGRVAQLLVVIPADDVAPVIGLIVVSRAVDSDLLGNKIETFFILIDLFDHLNGQTDVPPEQIRRVFLHVRIDIQREPLFPDLREVVVGDQDVRQVSAVHHGGVFLLRHVNIPNLRADLILQIPPHPQLVFSAHSGAGAVEGVPDRQHGALPGAGGAGGEPAQRQRRGKHKQQDFLHRIFPFAVSCFGL